MSVKTHFLNYESGNGACGRNTKLTSYALRVTCGQCIRVLDAERAMLKTRISLLKSQIRAQRALRESRRKV